MAALPDPPTPPLPEAAARIAAWAVRVTGEVVDLEALRGVLAKLQDALQECFPRRSMPPPPDVHAERLPAGPGSDVFRVWTIGGHGGEQWVLKHAHSTQGQASLAAVRLAREAEILRLLTSYNSTQQRPDGRPKSGARALLRGSSATVFPVWMRHYDPKRAVLLLGYYSELPDLIAWCAGAEAAQGASSLRARDPRPVRAHRRGVRVGRYVAAIHAGRHGISGLAARFGLLAQEAAHEEGSFAEAARLLATSEIPDAQALAAALHRTAPLPPPDGCLVHGALTPHAIRCGPEYTGLVDWGAAHAGQPGRDTGTLAAHLWRARFNALTADARALIEAFGGGFAEGYALIAPAAFLHGACLHEAHQFAAAELLVSDARSDAAPEIGRASVESPALRQAAQWLRTARAAASLAALFEAPIFEDDGETRG